MLLPRTPLSNVGNSLSAEIAAPTLHSASTDLVIVQHIFISTVHHLSLPKLQDNRDFDSHHQEQCLVQSSASANDYQVNAFHQL